MKRTMFALIAVLMLICVAGLQAEKTPAPKAVLQKGDVEKFMKSFPAMSKELYALGVQFDQKSGAADVPKALAANAKANALLKKYGWDDKYYLKLSVIMSGLYLLAYEQEANPQIEASIKQIEASPDLSAAQKKDMIAQLRQAMGDSNTEVGAAKASIHKDDLAQIKPRVKELMKMFKDLQAELNPDQNADNDGTVDSDADGDSGDDSDGDGN
jgi:hypothetical protein